MTMLYTVRTRDDSARHTIQVAIGYLNTFEPIRRGYEPYTILWNAYWKVGE